MQKSIFLVLMTLFLVGCSTDREPPALFSQKAQIVGHVNQALSDHIIAKFGTETLVKNLEDNKFHFEIDLNESVYVMLSNADHFNMLFLRPGDSLNLQIDPSSSKEEIVFSGGSVVENQFLNIKQQLKDKIGINNIQLFDRSPIEFKSTVLGFQKTVADQLQQHISENIEIDPLFKKQQKCLTNYEMGSLLLDYQLFTNGGSESAKLPADYFDFLEHLEINNAVIQNTAEYRSFISSYIARKTKLAGNAKNIDPTTHAFEWTQTKIEVIQNEVTLPKIRSRLITKAVDWHMYNHGCENIDQLIDVFKSTNPEAEDATRINRFANRCKSLRPGKPAPLFSGFDIDGNEVTLASLLGKYVYIDVWATWCGPCKKETPYFENLIDQYQDFEHMEFVSISMDEKPNSWESAMKRKPGKGIHLIAPKAFESKMALSYGISNIPRFILIDKEGMLINADAPLPSSEEIKPILAKLAAI